MRHAVLFWFLIAATTIFVGTLSAYAAGNVGAGALLQVTDKDLEDFSGGEFYAGWELAPNVILRAGAAFGSGSVGDVDLDAYSLEGAILLRTYPDLATFYAGFGVGYYFFDGDFDSLEDEPAFIGMVGCNISISESVTLDLTARLRNLKPSIEGGELDLSGVMVGAGLSVLF